MARYTHDLMQRGEDGARWGIVGVGLRPADGRLIAALAEQDCLYTLIERDERQARAGIMGALAGVIHAENGTLDVLHAIDRPEIAIVSLTVTQAGYCIDNGTKRLNVEHPEIVHDIAHPAHPRSAVGVLTAALARRRAAGRPPFAALSCDNIQHNGTVLREAVLELATRQDPVLAEWIEENGAFPCTMVDRITPVTTPADRTWLEETYGLRDACPVFCEPFTQWVIEDIFPAGRPAWEAVGVQWVEDVRPYEFIKLRLLNATHLAISATGQLMGLDYVHQAVRDVRIRPLAQILMARETGPTVPPVPGVDLDEYKRDVVCRFANPTIADTTERVNTDASLNYLLDPLRDCMDAGRPAPALSFAVAAWIRRCAGRDDTGRTLPVSNPTAAALGRYASQTGRHPDLILSHRETFGDLSDRPTFRNEVGCWLRRMELEGTAAGLSALLRGSRPE
jgi:fructuronate reductase/mannitol 2-dehydrogenase